MNSSCFYLFGTTSIVIMCSLLCWVHKISFFENNFIYLTEKEREKLSSC